ncbi:MAG: hypothetical protein PHT53_04540 [Candidatus Omnitrophica bacterium]|nr:hypothetical protein [Candidatus Omnitrophota bacterium]
MLREELNQFTGTENYYKHWLGKIVYTDGVKYLADKAEAHWLIDLIASYQPTIKNVPFQVWVLKVNADKSAEVTMHADADKPALIRQAIKYTTFPLDEIKLWLIDGVLILPSEY